MRAHASLRAQTADVGVDFAFAFGVSRETIPRARQSLARRVVIADEDHSILHVFIARAPTIIHALARVQIHHFAPRSQPVRESRERRSINPTVIQSFRRAIRRRHQRSAVREVRSHQPLDHHRVRHVADLHLVQAQHVLPRLRRHVFPQRPQRIRPPPALAARLHRALVQRSMYPRHERVKMRSLDLESALFSRVLARRVRERRLPSPDASVQVHPSPRARPEARAVVEPLQRVQRASLPVVARLRRRASSSSRRVVAARRRRRAPRVARRRARAPSQRRRDARRRARHRATRSGARRRVRASSRVDSSNEMMIRWREFVDRHTTTPSWRRATTPRRARRAPTMSRARAWIGARWRRATACECRGTWWRIREPR